MDILTFADLKVDTEYYIEMQTCNEDFTKYNGTYTFICNKRGKRINIVYCNFKNIEDKNITLIYNSNMSEFTCNFMSDNYVRCRCSISELTGEYVLK